MSKLPSGFRIHPSKYGTTSWPLAHFVCGIAVGSCCAPARLTAGSHAAANRHVNVTRTARLFIGALLLARVDALLIVRLVDVEQAHPRKAHLVDRPLPVA